MSLTLRSPSFVHGASIPPKHTSDGDGIAPALAWAGAPAATRSFALIVDDPDAPSPTPAETAWVHWVAYDIPAGTKALPEGGRLPDGSRDGINDWQRPGYGGPSPPAGRHRYFFKLFALDCVLGDLPRPSKAALEKAMQGHVLARAELIGGYRRRRSAPAR